jgi:NAD-dependent deacetylase
MKDAWLNDLIKRTDVFIGVGTSAQVQPAAGLLFQFKDTPLKYFVDPHPPLRLHSFTKLVGTACEHLPGLVDELIEKVDAEASL